MITSRRRPAGGFIRPRGTGRWCSAAVAAVFLTAGCAGPGAGPTGGDAGAVFRASGNEPPWVLELKPGRQLEFSTGYEPRVQRFSCAEPVGTGGAITCAGRAGGRRIEVTIVEGACRDTMSGEVFPFAVRVDLDGAIYRGCGRASGGVPW
jgi:uncharacterized membrane protein